MLGIGRGRREERGVARSCEEPPVPAVDGEDADRNHDLAPHERTETRRSDRPAHQRADSDSDAGSGDEKSACPGRLERRARRRLHHARQYQKGWPACDSRNPLIQAKNMTTLLRLRTRASNDGSAAPAGLR